MDRRGRGAHRDEGDGLALAGARQRRHAVELQAPHHPQRVVGILHAGPAPGAQERRRLLEAVEDAVGAQRRRVDRAQDRRMHHDGRHARAGVGKAEGVLDAVAQALDRVRRDDREPERPRGLPRRRQAHQVRVVLDQEHHAARKRPGVVERPARDARGHGELLVGHERQHALALARRAHRQAHRARGVDRVGHGHLVLLERARRRRVRPQREHRLERHLPGCHDRVDRQLALERPLHDRLVRREE
ncbi:MAG: hypothetical protein ACKOEP_08430, partial [Phycisphaerales bacterium]